MFINVAFFTVGSEAAGLHETNMSGRKHPSLMDEVNPSLITYFIEMQVCNLTA